MKSVRTYLRDQTRADHDATEAAFSGFDLATYCGLQDFLAVHYLANAAVEAARTNFVWPASLPSPPSALPSLALSLEHVGLKPEKQLKVPHIPEPVGAAYVVAGSRFGNRVLRQRWKSGTDPRTSTAGAYFEDQFLDIHARNLMAALTDYRPPDAAAVITSARMTFQTFADATTNLRDYKAIKI